MDSRKLSLPLIAAQIEHLADNAYAPNEPWVIALKINLRAIASTLRDNDGHHCACPTPGAEAGHRCPNCELWVAALAQQAQPLTDDFAAGDQVVVTDEDGTKYATVLGLEGDMVLYGWVDYNQPHCGATHRDHVVPYGLASDLVWGIWPTWETVCNRIRSWR